MREIRPSGSEGGARFKPLSPPLSRIMRTTLLLLGLSTKKLNAPISKAEYEFGLTQIKKEAPAFAKYLSGL